MNGRNAQGERAFTLIELLIVITVIAVLAAIAVPNFLEAQIRSKTSRTRSDMAVVNAALRAYFADYNAYPPNHPEVRRYLVATLDQPSTGIELLATPPDAEAAWTQKDEFASTRPLTVQYMETGWGGHRQVRSPLEMSGTLGLSVLTSPVRYLTRELPVDPYSDYRALSFVYVNLYDLPETTVTLAARRKGRRYILRSHGPDTQLTINNNPIHPVGGPFVQYDPTNGTVSSGDILEFGTWYDTGDETAEMQQFASPYDDMGMFGI